MYVSRTRHTCSTVSVCIMDVFLDADAVCNLWSLGVQQQEEHDVISVSVQ